MSDTLRRTVRAFLRWEKPKSKAEAAKLVRDWFSRYDPPPGLLDQEVAHHFAKPAEQPNGLWRTLGAPFRTSRGVDR